MESSNISDSDYCITIYEEGDNIITFPKAETNESSLNRKGLFVKAGIQERGTEWGECGERGECSLGFRRISLRIPGNVIISTLRGMLKKIPVNVNKESGEY